MSGPRFFAFIAMTAGVVFLGHLGIDWAIELAETSIPPDEPGRLQLVLDEQNVGVVQSGIPLEVKFAVANVGLGELRIRQASDDRRDVPTYQAITIEPGRTAEVIALLRSDDLQGRCQKHVHFLTTDPDSPDLWLTVRGIVDGGSSSAN